MTQYRIPRTLAATALGALAVGIAAPSMAQEITPAPAAQTPPPAITVAPAPPVTVQDVPAGAPALTTVTPAAPVINPTVSATTASPAPTAPTKPAVRQTAAKPVVSAPVRTRTTTSTPKPVSAPQPLANAAPDVAPPVTTVDAVTPVVPTTSNATTTQATTSTTDGDDWGEASAAIGLGLLGAAGIAGVAFRRRRRVVVDQSLDPMLTPPAARVPLSEAEPATIVPPVPASRPASPVMAAAPVAAAYRTAQGREVGRFEAAAERGPTADNPFLTRRARVRRARFYDRRERLAREAGIAPPPAVADRQPTAAVKGGQITYVFGKQGAPGGTMFPAFRKA